MEQAANLDFDELLTKFMNLHVESSLHLSQEGTSAPSASPSAG